MATRLTAVLIVAVSLGGFYLPGLKGALAKETTRIMAGEVWRLFTVALVHDGYLHLFFNVSVFLDVGTVVERLQGSTRMLVVFWCGTAAASLTSVLFVPQPAVGASGGVFALLGALFAVAYGHRRELPPAFRARLVNSTAMVIGANAILGFVIPRVDWAAHLGGVVAGAVLGGALGLDPAVRKALAQRRGGPGAGAR
ncbi:MAG TPA: rhomboid family intramembrane serine protease [Anaeromyxobacter sp.]|nr:rhomboid family intramembrane serine protease [Anaeromyxobacter sp.]